MPQKATLPGSRVLTGYTAPHILDQYAVAGAPLYERLRDLPTLFVEETQFEPAAPQFARVGRILSAHRTGSEVQIEFVFDQSVPPIPHSSVIDRASALGIEMHGRGFNELQTTHWAVKQADLYKEVLAMVVSAARMPTVFQLPVVQTVDKWQIAAMMPFSPAFNGVYEAIMGAAEDNGMACRRADDVWQHHAIIQDIVSLIDGSAVLVCDCTGKNANVFYEIGVAHALGKEVILITQHADDVPFDLRHLRYISYLNNREGCDRLRQDLAKRIEALTARAAG